MIYLVDTNILVRWSQPHLSDHAVAVAAVDELLNRGDDIRLTPQNIVEFWSVTTRPIASNGLGLEPSDAEHAVAKMQTVFKLLDESPAIHPEWLSLVVTHSVKGRQVHDARLVASMRVFGIAHILTFDTGDFQRYAGISAVHPGDVVSGP